MSRAERAKEYFLQGFACSQAVALAFADIIGIDETAIRKLMLPFGGGVGRLRLTCGAVSGMAFVIGAVFADGENTPENKKKTYAIVQELCGKFKEKTGSLICAELLAAMKVPVEIGGEAEKRTKEYYQKRSCADMVVLATEILEEYLIGKSVL
ncbi:MAG: C_GCAxxG_C_C family protein [Clostridiales bacterium]|nr:C_GCAxxG_C_C family protein [Clostridiales bacterium]